MRKNRFLTQLVSEVFVVVLAASGLLLIDGVSDAAPSASVRQVTATSTSTNLSTSPISSVEQSDPVTLTATISPAAAGTVQFKDGAVDLGTTVPVTSSSGGIAVASISTLPPGTHLLTAVFTPADPVAYDSSTSQQVTFIVVARPAATSTRRATILTAPTGSIDLLSPEEEVDARLTEAATGKPVVNALIDFYGAGQDVCHGLTDVTGWAHCSGAENLGPQTVREIVAGYYASFLGNDDYGPSAQHASATLGTGRLKP